MIVSSHLMISVREVPKKTEVVGLFYQSNTVGYNITGGDINDSDARVLQVSQGIDYGYTAGADGEIIPAQHPLQHSNPTGTPRIGFGIAFAKRRLELDPSIDEIVLVPRAVRGTGFSRDNWNEGDPEYDAFISAMQTALSYAGLAKPTLVLGIGGESDAADGATAGYQAALEASIAAMRVTLGNFRLHLGTMIPAWIGSDPDRLAIDAVHRSNNIPNYSFSDLTASVGEVTDPIHQTGASEEATGIQMANDLSTY